MQILFTAEEYANMNYIYGECKCNPSEAARLYRERYSNSRYSDNRMFVNVHRTYSQGQLPNGRRSNRKLRDDYDAIVSHEVEDHPGN